MAQKRHITGFFGHSVFALKASTRVPTQITCKLLNNFPVAMGRDFCRFASSASRRRASRRAVEGGGSIALANLPSTFIETFFSGPLHTSAVASRGAQYSRDWRLVNALS